MPYITTIDNKYIHEHSCNKYHYGDMSLIRECCINDAKYLKQLVLDKALTTNHPAYICFENAWNSLTDSEMLIVGNIAYLGNANGFKEL